ncbi:MAG: hypothetical protein JJT76_06060 [Clostridiaceae bacterium]|nr:hypothetical protein [Clostridiaceae bacterium]
MFKILKVISITIIFMVFIFIFIPLLFGYKIAYITEVNYDFQAISAVGQWVGAIIPIFLVFLSAFITDKINRAKTEITTNNIATIDYVNEMIEELSNKINGMNENGLNSKIETEEERLDRLKNKAFKYVSISGFAKTQKVAEHLNISKEEAFDVLNELMRVDGKISCGGRASKDNINNVIWLKR